MNSRNKQTGKKKPLKFDHGLGLNAFWSYIVLLSAQSPPKFKLLQKLVYKSKIFHINALSFSLLKLEVYTANDYIQTTDELILKSVISTQRHLYFGNQVTIDCNYTLYVHQYNLWFV